MNLHQHYAFVAIFMLTTAMLRTVHVQFSRFFWFPSQVIMPGYCVQGTVGHKILSGQRKLEMEGRQIVSFIFKEDHLGEGLQNFRW